MKKPTSAPRNIHTVFHIKALRAVAFSSLFVACVGEPDVFFQQKQHDDTDDGSAKDGDGDGPFFTGGGPGGDGDDQVADPTCPTADDAKGWNFPSAGCPCHEGPLYTEVEGADGRMGYYPVECADAPSSSILGGVCESGPQYPGWSDCVDSGHGFNAAGEFVEDRGAADLPALEYQHQDDQNTWNQLDTLGFKYNCHAGGQVVGTYDCGAVPKGAGGEIQPGTYALTGLVQYGTPNFLIAGNKFQQTLLVTETSMALQSDDNAIFIFKGRYLYSTSGRMITFETLEASDDDARRVPWTQEASFTATSDRLDFYSTQQGYWATFERAE